MRPSFLLLGCALFLGLVPPLLAAPAAKTLVAVEPSLPLPATKYSDGSQPLGFEKQRGRPFVLNIWATWCVPCVKELPALDRLAGKLAADGIAVVALSEDDKGEAQVKPFLEKLKVTQITQQLYDPDLKAFQDFSIRGLPTTFIVSAQGRIVAKLEGAAEWDSPEMIRQIKARLAAAK